MLLLTKLIAGAALLPIVMMLALLIRRKQLREGAVE